MSAEADKDGDRDRLEPLVDRALGPMVPTTTREVEDAEADGVELEGDLPAELAEYRPPSKRNPEKVANVRSLDEARDKRARASGGFGTHALAGLVGAAAAAALLLANNDRRTVPSGPDASRSVPTVTAAAGNPPPLVLENVGDCEKGCCGGADCEASKSDMATCPSGRTCISCSQAELAASEYRLKIGGFAPAELARKSLEAGPLEVCVRVASSELVCAPAFTDKDGERWTELPLVATSGDVLSGVTVQVRFVGAKAPLAEWNGVVAVTPVVLCKGMLVEPKTKIGELFGTLSMFVVDTHYVELGRAADTASLRRLADGVETDLPLAIFETTAAGAERFALVVGPMTKPDAERIRWTLLEAGREASAVTGTGYRGDPRRLE